MKAVAHGVSRSEAEDGGDRELPAPFGVVVSGVKLDFSGHEADAGGVVLLRTSAGIEHLFPVVHRGAGKDDGVTRKNRYAEVGQMTDIKQPVDLFPPGADAQGK